MIGRLHGTLLDKRPPTLLVDVGGVGYVVDVPMSTFYDLPPVGERVTLLTQQVVREDAHLLYGFLRADERDAFRQLIRISGVGPRTALAVLSGMSVADLAQSVALQESARLQKVPGIGKKTAERLLLELKGKLGSRGRRSRRRGRDRRRHRRAARAARARLLRARRRRRRSASCRPAPRSPTASSRR